MRFGYIAVLLLDAISDELVERAEAHVALDNREDEVAVRLNARVCVLGVKLHQRIVDALAATP